MVDSTRIFTDPTDVEPGFEPMMYSIPYPSGGVKVNGLLMTAAGREPSPLVVLLHGFPGTERNLDVAQALRMAGCHVAFFHYRGAWGSGTFSFSHVLEDPCSVIDYLKSPEVAAQYRIDTDNIFVVGHSMGGFAALLTGAARDDLRGVAGIAPYDFGKAYLAAMADPSGAQAYEQVMGQPLPELKLETPDVLLKDLRPTRSSGALTIRLKGLPAKMSWSSALTGTTPPPWRCTFSPSSKRRAPRWGTSCALKTTTPTTPTTTSAWPWRAPWRSGLKTA